LFGSGGFDLFMGIKKFADEPEISIVMLVTSLEAALQSL